MDHFATNDSVMEDSGGDWGNSPQNVTLSTCHVSTIKSAQIKVLYEHHPVHLAIIDSGTEVSMIMTSFAKYIGASIKRMTHRALQVYGVTSLESVREVDLCLK